MYLLWDGCCRYDAIVCGIVFTDDSVGRSGRVVVHEQRVFHFHLSGLEKTEQKKNANVLVNFSVCTPDTDDRNVFPETGGRRRYFSDTNITSPPPLNLAFHRIYRVQFSRRQDFDSSTEGREVRIVEDADRRRIGCAIKTCRREVKCRVKPR